MRLLDSRRLEETGNHILVGETPTVNSWQLAQHPSNGGDLSGKMRSSIQTSQQQQQQQSTTQQPRDFDAPRLDLVDEQIRSIDPSCVYIMFCYIFFSNDLSSSILFIAEVN